MLIETELQNRLLGLIPPHEQQQHYAAIFRVSPDLATATAYIDGWLASASVYTKIIEQLITRNIEEKDAV